MIEVFCCPKIISSFEKHDIIAGENANLIIEIDEKKTQFANISIIQQNKTIVEFKVLLIFSIFFNLEINI